MTTLILHPGSPKTATSTLQQILRGNRAHLAAEGVGLILPEDLRGKPFLGRFLSAYRGTEIPDMDQHCAAFFKPFLARHDYVICSEETFCHDFMPSRKFAQGGIDRADIAAALLSRTGAARTRVVLSIRPQVDFLISTYTHFVHRHRESNDFATWLTKQVDLPRLLWEPAVQAFRNHFGAEAVHVVSLAMTRQVGMVGYLQTMMDAFGIGHLNLEMRTDRVHNPSPSLRAVHLCRVMNREIANQRRSEIINSALVETFPVSEFGKFTPPEWSLSDDLVKLYEADHATALFRPQ